MLKSSMAPADFNRENILWMDERAAKHVVERFTASNRIVLGLDGFMHAGKSPISLMLEYELAIECIHIDDYLPPPSRSHEELRFLDVLDMRRLHTDIRSRLKQGPALIEGIMIRDVCSPWYQDGSLFNVYVAAAWRPSPTEVRWNEVDRLSLGITSDSLDAQIVKYHMLHSPYADCDVAILRDQDGFGSNGRFLAPDSQTFSIPTSVLQASRFHQHKRVSNAFACSSAGALPIPLGLVTPPILSQATRSLSEDRIRRILTGIVDSVALPPVVTVQVKGSNRRHLLDGAHRYFAASAAGFTRLPAVQVSLEDAQESYGYTP